MTDPTSPTPSTSSVSVADGIPPVTVTEAERQQYRAQWPLTAGIYDVTDPVYAIPHLLGALEVAERALDASRAETAALREERDRLANQIGTAYDDLQLIVTHADNPSVYPYGFIRTIAELLEGQDDVAPTPGADGGTT